MSKKTNKMVTRAAVIRAFSSPGRSRRDTMEIVARYMGDSPAPPSWSTAGVRGTFGKAIARAWAKKIRHLRLAFYRSPNTMRAITPVVQTAYDLGTTPERLAFMMNAEPTAPSSERVPFVMDEFHMPVGRQAWTLEKTQ